MQRDADQNDLLPIDDVLPDICSALADHGCAVLIAPPGTGKTTRVPIVLSEQPWAKDSKIIVLEPRRIAARAAANRMAELSKEPLGKSIGLKARLNSRGGPHTRIDVVTEGVFTRMILDDPELPGVMAVLFDEFHERSLDADFGLALALESRAALRPDLKILVMSATLDDDRIAKHIAAAPVIQGQGRMYPVETHYQPRKEMRLEQAVCKAVMQAVRTEAGSILVFLPGQAEIQRTQSQLEESNLPYDVDIYPLYGALPPSAQDQAIQRAEAGRRKIVLATAIAETSITIEGARVVIDSGLQRVPRYEPDSGLTRLETVRVSRASAEQRKGRAGRTEPGVCVRLWDEAETQGLVPFNAPEIFEADLSGLVLDCADWGATHVDDLPWLDLPPAGRWLAAQTDLQKLGALDDDGRITELGRTIRKLPLPPRLAKMLIEAASVGAEKRAGYLAAIIVERGIGGRSTDITERLERFEQDKSGRAQNMRRLAETWASQSAGEKQGNGAPDTSVSELLAFVYPERIAKQRGLRGHFLLASGRAAFVEPTDPLADANYLVVADLHGRATATRILLASRASEEDAKRIAAGQAVTTESTEFDRSARALRKRRNVSIGAIVLESTTMPVPGDSESAELLAKAAVELGVEHLPWSKQQRQLRQRAAFLEANGVEVVDLSGQTLASDSGAWLAPFLIGKTGLNEITSDTLGAALDSLISWHARQRIDSEAPTHFTAPTGHNHVLDYESDGAPVLAIRVQELYGLKSHPSIAEGRLPLTLHLLSPAGRPIQITRDLPGFWTGSWAAVRADMRGRYPKHVWPEDPASANPTRRAKPRGK